MNDHTTKVSRFRGSNLVAAGILLSRVAGLARTLVVAVVLGSSPASDVFFNAMRVPNFLQNLLGEGSLSASFVPVYSRLLEEGEEERASALASSVVSLLALATTALVLIGVLLARPLIWLLTGWELDQSRYELAIDVTRITTVGIGMLVISAWCLGVLNSHRSFFLSYAAPVIWNLAQITGVVAAALIGLTDASIVIVLAWAMVVGSVLQVAVQLPKVRRLSPGVGFGVTRSRELSEVLRRFAPAVGARGVVQVSSLLDTVLATSIVGGALSFYSYTLQLYILPISLFGFSVAVAELTEMSRRSDSPAAVVERLRPALLRVLVPAAFIAAAYLVAGRLIIDALYGWPSRLFDRGLTDPAAITTIGLLLTAFAVGLPATMTARVSQNTLYSQGDVRGPARIALVRLVVSVTLSALLMFQLDWLTFDAASDIVAYGDFPNWPPWERVDPDRRASGVVHLGVVGLGLGTSAGAWVEWALLRQRLRRRFGHVVDSGATVPVVLATVACVATMALGRFATIKLGIPSPLDAAVVVLAGAAVYLIVLRARGIALSALR